MGAYLSSPITTKNSEDGAGKRLRYGASAMQGWRMHMEVRNCARLARTDLFVAICYDCPPRLCLQITLNSTFTVTIDLRTKFQSCAILKTMKPRRACISHQLFDSLLLARWRTFCQDAHIVAPDIIDGISLFAVFGKLSYFTLWRRKYMSCPPLL
jgi:hypothetical protein